MTKIAVVYATVGRADLAGRSVGHLARQSRPADLVVVSAVSPDDFAQDRDGPIVPEVLYGEKGLCAQRNRALAHIAGRADIVVFFDDDFVPADDYLANLATLFDSWPELAGATGWVVADGIKTPGIRFDDAVRQLEGVAAPAEPVVAVLDGGLYGCNMAMRTSLTEGLWFDEAMPLYGWLEDLDFTFRLRARGPLVWSDRLTGVHLGTKGGRTSGMKLGYSQIANPVYMLRKRSAPRRHVIELMIRNVASNLFLSIRPEPYVDRFGRLRGNLLALRDLASSRLDPMRVLRLD